MSDEMCFEFQVLRADLFATSMASLLADEETASQLKPEMQWQIDAGLKQGKDKVRSVSANSPC